MIMKEEKLLLALFLFPFLKIVAKNVISSIARAETKYMLSIPKQDRVLHCCSWMLVPSQ